MLNITTRISLTRRSRARIRELKARQHDNFTQAAWGLIHREVKHEISAKLFNNQGLKCVYCERYLIGLGHEIDHFAHKGEYPQFTFVPINLFYSCKLCNSSERKGQKSTIDNLDDQYNLCTFSIVHPFINNPDIEILYTDEDRVYFDRVNCSQLGRDTIDFFNWGDLIYTNIRSRILTYERLNPLTSVAERELIHASLAYRQPKV